MRLGQILLEANLLTPKQLAYGLEYCNAKNLFIGRALVVIRYLSEDDLNRSLKAQDLIINVEISPLLVFQALKTASKEDISLERALQILSPTYSAVEKSLPPARAVHVLEEDSPAVLFDSGDALLLNDQCAEAEVRFRKALELLEKSHGDNSIELAPALVRLGNTYLAMSLFEQGRTCYERLLWLKTKYCPDQHLEIAQTFESLADLYAAEQDVSRTIWAYLSAIDLLEKMLPEQLVVYTKLLRKLVNSVESPRDGINVSVGTILIAAGLITDADLSKALTMSKFSSNPLGVVLRENGIIGDRDFQSALKAQFCLNQGLLSESLAIKLLIRACRREVSLDRLLHEAGIFESSEKMDVYKLIASELDQLVVIESSDLSAKPQLATIECKLAELYNHVGDKTQSEFYYRRAIANWRADDKANLDLANACSVLVGMLVAQGRQAECAPFLRTAYEQRNKALGSEDELTMKSLEDVAENELLVGSIEKAQFLLQGVFTARENLGQNGVKFLRAMTLSGDCLAKKRDFEGAVATYNEAIGLAKLDGANPSYELAIIVEKLADVRRLEESIHAAHALYKQAKSIVETIETVDQAQIKRLNDKLRDLEQVM